MKKNFLLIAILSLVLFACGPVETTDTAIDYDADMMDVQNDVDEVMVDLLDEIAYGDADAIIDAEEKAANVINDAQESIEEMDDFDGKDDYKKAMLDLVEMYEDILENEFAEIIDYMIYYDELTDEEWEYTTELEDNALTKYDEAFADFDEFREAFADEWEFSLLD